MVSCPELRTQQRRARHAVQPSSFPAFKTGDHRCRMIFMRARNGTPATAHPMTDPPSANTVPVMPQSSIASTSMILKTTSTTAGSTNRWSRTSPAVGIHAPYDLPPHAGADHAGSRLSYGGESGTDIVVTILLSCHLEVPASGVVCGPFVGSGTTCAVAELGYRFSVLRSTRRMSTQRINECYRKMTDQDFTAALVMLTMWMVSDIL